MAASRSTRANVLPAGLALLLAIALAGCGASVEEPEVPIETPTIEPEVPEPTEPEVDGALLHITANVRSRDGATIGIRMTVHPALANDDPDASELRDEFLATCTANPGGAPITADTLAANGASLVRIELVADDPGQRFEAPLELYFNSVYSLASVTGASIRSAGGSAGCFSGHQWTGSDPATAIASFENLDGRPDLDQWMYAVFGFSTGIDTGATIEACEVELVNAVIGDTVPGWDPADAGTGKTCLIGYRGE